MRRKVYCHRIPFSSQAASDKPTRARAIQGRVAMRGLWLPVAAPWADDAESELLKFPTGKHDDIVDTLSLIGRMIAGIEQGKVAGTGRGPAAGVRSPSIQAGGIGRSPGNGDRRSQNLATARSTGLTRSSANQKASKKWRGGRPEDH